MISRLLGDYENSINKNYNMETNNVIMDKSKKFALRIIKLTQYLRSQKKEYILSKQVMRSGTSIGANVREGNRGQTKPDFITKMNIALKEAEETSYWLELLYESGYINSKSFTSIYEDNLELLRILTTIVFSARHNLKNKRQNKTTS